MNQEKVQMIIDIIEKSNSGTLTHEQRTANENKLNGFLQEDFTTSIQALTTLVVAEELR